MCGRAAREQLLCLGFSCGNEHRGPGRQHTANASDGMGPRRMIFEPVLPGLLTASPDVQMSDSVAFWKL